VSPARNHVLVVAILGCLHPIPTDVLTYRGLSVCVCVGHNGEQ